MHWCFLRVEAELRDDAEVAIATATTGFQQLVIAVARMHFAPGIDQTQGYELVAGETLLLCQQAIAAAERQPAYAHSLAGSGGQDASFG